MAFERLKKKKLQGTTIPGWACPGCSCMIFYMKKRPEKCPICKSTEFRAMGEIEVMDLMYRWYYPNIPDDISDIVI